MFASRVEDPTVKSSMASNFILSLLEPAVATVRTDPSDGRRYTPVETVDVALRRDDRPLWDRPICTSRRIHVEPVSHRALADPNPRTVGVLERDRGAALDVRGRPFIEVAPFVNRLGRVEYLGRLIELLRDALFDRAPRRVVTEAFV